MIPAADDLILVTGGNGFIGAHLVRHFLEQGHRVRVVDIAARSSLDVQPCPRLEVIIGNLCDKNVCSKAVGGVHTILHFAANMGGMGAIHCDNDFKIYTQNHAMTLNLLSVASAAGVKQFLYASSACVYPESLQDSTDNDVSLRETDVWENAPPRPQGLYGLEKLSTEMLLAQQASSMVILIPRFHNVYGPGNAWNNGREKAPAAMLRKALAAKMLQPSPASIEVWGDGKQRRSFLWVGDCVDAILRLLHSSFTEPINIGSDRAVSIQNLAEIALVSAGMDPAEVSFQYNGDSTKLVGVTSRNSNNESSKRALDWEPKTSLEVGMRQTAEWIKQQMARELQSRSPEMQKSFLTRCLTSKIINLDSDTPVFAVLLPVTSRGSANENDCLSNLARFSASLARTTVDDVFSVDPPFRLRVYVAIDDDDEFLLPLSNGFNKVETILRQHGITDISTYICSVPRGHVCSLWRHLARKAWEDESTYMVLMGDDVTLEDNGWMTHFHAAFTEMANRQGVPLGFGCVAFTDSTFEGMPTFPVVHRTHLDIFDGTVVPEEFINQDGDPYLFQLYRRFGCSEMIAPRISNSVGGSDDARYQKIHASDWTFGTLRDGVSTAQDWLRKQSSSVEQKLTLDIIIPCYRVKLEFLRPILALEPSPTCSVSRIVIIDDPHSANIAELEKEYGKRPDVRIRVNSRNMGASFSRNRGLAEATAKWVLFLDDDVIVEKDLLIEAEKVIRSHPDAAGFVGLSWFPPANTVFTAAIHLSGVTWFWNVAQKIDADLPWGVTANLIARRDVKDDVKFDLSFPKTGGGEDIDFCRKKRDASIAAGNQGFLPAPGVRVTHPWWSGGSRSYWRFYMWGQGDGGLIKVYPELTYRDFPNSAELILGCALACGAGVVFGVATGSWGPSLLGLKCGLAVVLANIIHDCYRHLWRDVSRTLSFETGVTGLRWVAAVVESALIRMASEGGRTVGILKRHELSLLGKRLDWFAGKHEGAIVEERLNSLQRVCLCLVLVLTVLYRA
ncbi:NAD-dependent epimerase/dehydratase [Mycena capillaripes]|nr:NAD-dependent epimerase/dehydratase [Mycena capillaripes]